MDAAARAYREAPAADPVQDLLDLVGPDLDRVNALILERMQSPVPLIPELAGHLIRSGGKRLRPMLTLASARLCGYAGDHHIRLAATVEFIHTATLLHDDVVDSSDLRRGKPSANAIWGNQSSVLVGDFLFSRAFQLMVATGSLRVLDILADASAVIAEGEVMQLAASRDISTNETTYLTVIECKTAALFAAAAEVGAVVAGAGAEAEEALRAYGRNLGVAFQLVDDALDYSGRQLTMGKAVGGDLKEGKITLPVILAYKRGGAEDRGFLRRALEERGGASGDLARTMQILERHGALADTLARAESYAARASEALHALPAGPHKDALAGLCRFVVTRAF